MGFLNFQNLMTDMVKEEEERRERLLNGIAVMLEQVHVVSKELKCEPETQRYTNLPLIDVQSKLKAQLEALKRKKDQRLRNLQELQEKVKHRIVNNLPDNAVKSF